MFFKLEQFVLFFIGARPISLTKHDGVAIVEEIKHQTAQPINNNDNYNNSHNDAKTLKILQIHIHKAKCMASHVKNMIGSIKPNSFLNNGSEINRTNRITVTTRINTSINNLHDINFNV